MTGIEMKRIKLTQDKFAIVDDEDFNYLNQWKWYFLSGYAIRNSAYVKGKKRYTIRMHRVINNTPDGFETDHINRNKLDNRRANLRTVTTSQNQTNTNLQKNNKSGYKGVVWDKNKKKWMAQIMINRKNMYLGYYSNLQSAWLARRWGERAYKRNIVGYIMPVKAE